MKRRFLLPAWAIILIDLLAIGAALCLFSLFHHVLPRTLSEGQVIEAPALFDFSEKFPDRFTSDGTSEKTENTFRNREINLTLSTMERDGAVIHVCEVYLRHVTSLKTAFAGGAFSKSVADSTLNMALENDALFAVSGDYYGIRDRGVVIRNGVVYRTEKAHQVCVLYYDGSLKTYPYSEFNAAEAVKNGAWQAWDFGPALLREGKRITEFDTGIAGKNPRCAIGYFEPGHYLFLAVDGRQASSSGLSLVELSALFEDFGCKEAYNLDGGHSAVMVWNGAITSSPSKKGGRDISDIIYISCDP